jgi:hypothetical protein
MYFSKFYFLLHILVNFL